MSKDIMNEILSLAGCKKVNEGLRDYLPRAGRIRDAEGNGLRRTGFVGQGTDEEMRKANIIAYVKGANGEHFGRVTKADLDNFEEYERQYNLLNGMGGDDVDEPVNEGLGNFMPRVGFERDMDDNRIGVHAGLGTKDKLEMDRIIAMVKVADRDPGCVQCKFGIGYNVKQEDRDNFEYYQQRYNELFGDGVTNPVFGGNQGIDFDEPAELEYDGDFEEEDEF